MGVQVQCSACGFRYNAPDSFVGKRVRCKQCGQVFTIGGASIDAPEADPEVPAPPAGLIGESVAAFEMSAQADDAAPVSNPAHSEKQQIKSAFKKLHEGERKIMSFGTEGPEVDVDAVLRGDGLDESDSPVAGSMKHVGSFDYPYSAMVEQYLPYVLLALCLLFVGMQTFSLDAHGIAWVAPVRLVVLLVTFVGIIFPMAYGGLKGAIRQTGQGMPFNPKIKALGGLILPVTLGYILWIAGESIVSLCLGIFLGLVLGLGAIGLLYRIRPENAARPLIRTAAWFIGASAVAIGFLTGINLTVHAIIISSGSNELAVSPIAPNMPWPEPAKPVAKKPKPARPATPTTQAGTTPAPVTQPAIPPVAHDPTPPAPPQTQPVEVVSHPPTPVPVEPAPVDPLPVPPDDQAVNPTPVPPPPSNPLPPVATIQWAPEVREVQPIDGVNGFDQLVTPLVDSMNRLLVRKTAEGDDDLELWSAGPSWQRIAQSSLKKDPQIPSKYVLTPTSQTVLRIASWPSLSVQAWSFKENKVVSTVELNAQYGTPELAGCISDDQAVIFWTNGQLHGIQLVTLAPGRGQAEPGWKLSNFGVQTLTNNFAVARDGKSVFVAGVARDGAVIAQLQLPTGKVMETINIPMLDPKWGVKPSALTISPDGQILATMFENQGNVLVVQWQLPKRTLIGDPIPLLAGTIAKPPTQFTGQAIGWVGNKSLLLYGRDLLNLETGDVRPLCDVSVLGVVRAQPDLMELILPGEPANRQKVISVQVNPPPPAP